MIGLLWFDDSPRDLKDRVEPAVRRYTDRFGRQPTICYAHPSALNGLGSSENGTSGISLDIGGLSLRVEARRSVLRYHFFVGEADAGSPGQS